MSPRARDAERERARDRTVHRSQRRHARVRLRRRVALALCVGLVVLGLGATGLGTWVRAHPEGRTPVPVEAGVPLLLPERPVLAGDLVLYGVRTRGGPPTASELGCEVTDAEGLVLPGALSSTRAAGEGRAVVDGQGLVPLLTVEADSGSSLLCSSPRTVRAAPTYLLPADSARDLVPVAAYSAAAVALPFGLALLVLLGLYRP
ncbi:hypothetical protein [Aquipuribacter hungaricus]|uniref:Uncharacterized protein n=2 Tax=Aquipuribacter hungaricus TaxID=545624 RepID=A0ABV7WME3_9MICO